MAPLKMLREAKLSLAALACQYAREASRTSRRRVEEEERRRIQIKENMKEKGSEKRMKNT